MMLAGAVMVVAAVVVVVEVVAGISLRITSQPFWSSPVLAFYVGCSTLPKSADGRGILDKNWSAHVCSVYTVWLLLLASLVRLLHNNNNAVLH
eukprot:m.176354 g.176354  ORF g.176354 m.176354 type:complete len:93 (-) comp24438_c0_seq1:49-327(-)